MFRLRFCLYTLLLLFCFARASLVEEVCSSAAYPLNTLCSASFDLPTGGLTVLTKKSCTNNCCTWDCGQCVRNFGGGCAINIPCSGCSKQQCGESCTDIPDGLRIDTKRVTLCNSNMRDLVTRAQAVCSCLQEVVDFVDNLSGNLESSSQSLRVTALQGAADVQTCLTKKSFDVQNNKQSQVQSTAAKGGTLIYAPTIDTSTYVDIGVAIGVCAISGACDTIVDLFYNYFSETIDAIGTGLENVLKSKIEAPIKAAEQKVDQFLSKIKTLPDQIDAEIDRCSSSFSAPATLNTFKQSIEDISSFYDNAKDLVSKVDDAIDTVSTATQALSGSYLTHLRNMVASRDFPELDDSISFLLESGGVSKVLGDISSFVSSDVPNAINALNNLQNIDNSLQNDLDRLSGNCDFDGIESFISAAIADVQSLSSEIESLLSFDVGTNSLQAGIISYNQWFSVGLDLPCVRMESITRSKNGFFDTLKYPKIDPCYFNIQVPMPNEHIPYLRVKI